MRSATAAKHFIAGPILRLIEYERIEAGRLRMREELLIKRRSL
jgi:hypothetical protein